MDRSKLFGLFTGTHLTILAGIAMIVPGALFAASAFTSVVIQDTGGRQATVIGGKLNVYDPVADPLAGYAKDPNNFVRFQVSKQCMVEYRVPAGKALIIQSMTTLTNATTGTALSTVDLYIGAGCNTLIGSSSGTGNETIYQTFGPGIVIPAGIAISSYHYEGSGYAFVYGYLVPSSAAPTTAAVEATAAPSFPRNTQNRPVNRHNS